VVAALLTLSGAQLTLLHLVGMLLVVALGSNYALFFEAAHDRDARGDSQVDSQLDPRGMQPATVASLLFANLSTIAGFGVLAFSSVPLLRSFGETVAPGALLVLLFSAMLSRPLSSLLTQSTSPPISRATNSATSIAAKAHADETEVLR
jgi:predicted exporter